MGKAGIPGRAKQQHRIKVLHPQSRKALKVTGKCMRKQRIQKKHAGTAIKQSLLLDKLQWFKDNRDESKDSYTRTDMEELVNKYIHRFDEELEQIEIIHGMKSRKNRQHAAREDVIKMTMQREEEAFKTSGIEMPDISDVKNLEFFLKWDGTSKHAHMIKMKKVQLSQKTKPKKDNDTKEANQDEEENGSEDSIDGDEDKIDDVEDKIDGGEERTDSMDVDTNP